MASVPSRSRKVYAIQWSHSCRPRWPLVSQDRLGQEGNYPKSDQTHLQGDTPKIPAQVVRADTCGKKTHLGYLHM